MRKDDRWRSAGAPGGDSIAIRRATTSSSARARFSVAPADSRPPSESHGVCGRAVAGQRRASRSDTQICGASDARSPTSITRRPEKPSASRRRS